MLHSLEMAISPLFTLDEKPAMQLYETEHFRQHDSFLLVSEHGLLLRDDHVLRYEWNLINYLGHAIVIPFSLDKAMTCHMGGISTICHKKIRNIMVTRLTEICHNVAHE